MSASVGLRTVLLEAVADIATPTILEPKESVPLANSLSFAKVISFASIDEMLQIPRTTFGVLVFPTPFVPLCIVELAVATSVAINVGTEGSPGRPPLAVGLITVSCTSRALEHGRPHRYLRSNPGLRVDANLSRSQRSVKCIFHHGVGVEVSSEDLTIIDVLPRVLGQRRGLEERLGLVEDFISYSLCFARP